MAVRPVSDFVAEAKSKKAAIEADFLRAVTANPAQALELVNARNSRVQREVYEAFENRRKEEYERERDINVLRLSCRAGRGRPFGGVPKASSSGTVRRDTQQFENVLSENRVDVNSSIAGGHSITVDTVEFAFVNFEVHCNGVAAEDTTRGHGEHDATLHASFKFKSEAIATLVADDRRALEREVGT